MDLASGRGGNTNFDNDDRGIDDLANERPPLREYLSEQLRLSFAEPVDRVIGAYLIAFVVGNDEQASVNFVFADATTSLIWVILLSLLAGLVGGVLLSQLHRRRQTRRSEASMETPSSISDGDA